MRIKLLLLVLFTIQFSCSLNKNKPNSKPLEAEAKYDKHLVTDFKYNFFCSCLNKAYQNSSSIKNIMNGDRSRGSDFPLGITNYRRVDSLAAEVNLEIIQDSIAITKFFCGSRGCDKEELERMYANGKIGKRIIKHCLEYYESKELDDFAKKSIAKKD